MDVFSLLDDIKAGLAADRASGRHHPLVAGVGLPLLGLEDVCPEFGLEPCSLYGGDLTAMAAAWMNAGGLAREIVEVLYNILGAEEGCDQCGDTLVDCWYLGTEFRVNVEAPFGWTYLVFCCCSKRLVIPGPGVPHVPTGGGVIDLGGLKP